MATQKVTPYNSENSKKEQVEQMFDNIAPTYSFLNHFLSFGIDKRWRKKVVKKLLEKEPKKILDIAAGTGDLSFALLKLKPEKIVGLDLSEKMLSVARKEAKVKDMHHKIEFTKGDSESLPFKDKEFDAITCAFGVRNFENLDKGLAEMYRALKPDGKIVILEFSQPKSKFVAAFYNLYFNKILPTIGNLISKDKRAYTYLPVSVHNFAYGESFCKHLKKVGFSKTHCTPLTSGIATIYEAQK